MIVHLYRESILNIFTEIRNDTAEKKLNVNLSTERIVQRKTRRNVQIQTDFRTAPVEPPPFKPAKRKHLRNIRIQTDFVAEPADAGQTSDYTMSLDDRIKLIEKKFREGQPTHCFPDSRMNRFNENRKRRYSSMESPHSSVDSSIGRPTVERNDFTTTNPSTVQSTPVDIAADDHVSQEMMALFGEDDEETDIFGEVISRRPSASELSDKTKETARSEHFNQMDRPTGAKTKVELSKPVDYTNELKNSIWPCELHMQRMKLNRALLKKADKGFRYSEKLRQKFEELFGPEDDDEENSFVPYRLVAFNLGFGTSFLIWEWRHLI